MQIAGGLGPGAGTIHGPGMGPPPSFATGLTGGAAGNMVLAPSMAAPSLPQIAAHMPTELANKPHKWHLQINDPQPKEETSLTSRSDGAAGFSALVPKKPTTPSRRRGRADEDGSGSVMSKKAGGGGGGGGGRRRPREAKKKDDVDDSVRARPRPNYLKGDGGGKGEGEGKARTVPKYEPDKGGFGDVSGIKGGEFGGKKKPAKSKGNGTGGEFADEERWMSTFDTRFDQAFASFESVRDY